ncbi:HAD-IB family hydrolase [Chryseolinea soli]|uniref:HAD-IB family hydrolase n=1 Tax=Chryseolinea soli TaxID=2321403 RepID=A0A385ST41_9BACT|nr:HAD-IB family hydrolase [Chryseolinea soli]AYB33155.1 HAD-IB family hydrolase [Chryseolinea soli]
MAQKHLVLFDFDGTLTRKDTLFAFIRFYHGTLRFLLGFAWLSPVMALYMTKLIRNDRAKEIVLKHFFGNVPVTKLRTKGIEFATTVVPSLLRDQGLALLKDYKQKQYDIAVVSASPEDWVGPWCAQWQIRCLATQLETRDNLLTGKIKGQNCFGEEKARRIREAYDLAGYDRIIAYGDSRGDREMLALATDPHYRSIV